jgi:hypothetical protein
VGSCIDVGHGSCREDGFCVRSRPMAIGRTASSARIKRDPEKASGPATRHAATLDGSGTVPMAGAPRSCPRGANPRRRSGMDREVLGLGRCLQRPRNRDRPPGYRGCGRTSCFSDEVFSWSGTRPISSRRCSTIPRGCTRLVSCWGDAAERTHRNPWDSVPLHRPRCGGPTDCRLDPAGGADRLAAELIYRSDPRQPSRSASLGASNSPQCWRNPPRPRWLEFSIVPS